MSYIYRKAMPEDVRPALDLALRVFMEFEAPEYEPEAVDKFKADIVYNEQFIKNWENGTSAMYVALDNNKVVGVIGEKWNNGHINIVFVDGNYHRRGIATELMNHMVCDLKLRGFDKITLFSSPYGLPFYLNYGFTSTDVEQHSDGFIFIPVVYVPNEIWDVLDENGDKTGRYHERGRPMATKDYHLAVHVWKHNGKGEWLIDRRAYRTPNDIGGGKWETTGGAAIAGEDSLTTALREAKEELGIDLNPAKGKLFWQFTNQVSDEHRCLIDVWVFKHDCEIEELRFQTRETCGAMWANADQIRELIRNNEFFSEARSYFDEMVEDEGY
ncbi:MAG: GNAT family N-acetyltransferase [Eubacteriales bacterium]|nr:GNAT family N-acetyltransferase [Eubacteriales bacterium]